MRQVAAQSPEQVAQRWAQNLGGASQKWADGVNSVTIAPGQLAARQKQVYAANVAAAQEKWASRVASVSLQAWQQETVQKGQARLASGATAGQPKMAAFMTQFLPFVEAGKGRLPARGNLDQNIARLTAWVRYVATFKRA